MLLLLLLKNRWRQRLWYFYCWRRLMTAKRSIIREHIDPFRNILPFKSTRRRCYSILLALPWLWNLQGCPPFCFIFSLFPTLVNDLYIVVKYRCNHGHHVSFDDPRSDTLRTTDSNVDNALESQIPFPHFHHFLAPALLQNAH